MQTNASNSKLLYNHRGMSMPIHNMEKPSEMFLNMYERVECVLEV